jgi:hypothetical protein
MGCKIAELFRLPAVVAGDPEADGSNAMTGEPATLLVFNPLAAPIFIRYGTSVPTPQSYDLACPGEAVLAWPIMGTGVISAIVVYPGAVPAGDVGQEAIVSYTEATLPAFVGPLNV